MNQLLETSISCIYKDFMGWSLRDYAWLAIAVSAIILAGGGTPLEVITAVTNVVCVLLVAKGRLSSYYWGLVGVVGLAFVAFDSKLYGTALLNTLYIAVQFIGWYLWSDALMKNDQAAADVKVRTLGLLNTTYLFGILGVLALVSTTVMRMFFPENPYPHLDSIVLIGSLIAMWLMVSRYAEQWLFWILANICCIVMWVIPAWGGEGSMSIVLMWMVFTINSMFGFYKWFIVKEGK